MRGDILEGTTTLVAKTYTLPMSFASARRTHTRFSTVPCSKWMPRASIQS